MPTAQKSKGLPSLWGLLLVGLLAACGSDSSNGQAVTVNLSLIVDARQAHAHSLSSRVLAWIERWFPGATPAWAQSVTEIASIQVDITGPGIAVPASTTVPVSDPTSGQQIPVSIQAPVGPNRTITVTASNTANEKIFGGTLPGVNLTAGAPIDLELTLVRLFTVTVNKDGDGSGTVSSSPAGITCDPACATQAQQFQEGTTVSLNAAAAPGSTFAGWSGACSGTAACSVTDNATVTARFNVAVSTDQLIVNLAGNGTGTVTSDPSGISCPGACAADFATGTTVTLTATPTNGSTFNGWSGGGCTGTGPCVVAIVGDQTVTATFTAAPVLFTLTVTKAGTGAGTVSSDPPGITACATTCSANFAPGTIVTLTATPQSGSTFVGWGGACSGTGLCQVTMDVNRAVTATFDPPVSLSTLTLQKTGTGTGTVTSNPAGIDCGPTCGTAAAPFPTGSSVTLTAAAAPGSIFVGWSGGGCSGTAPCTTANTGQTVVATFDLAPVTLMVNTSGPGQGTVTSSQGGISCPGTCTASFPPGTTVILSATPIGNSVFAGWQGGSCEAFGTGPCTITMSDNQSANARFERFGGGG
jgi:hypothetical protein